MSNYRDPIFQSSPSRLQVTKCSKEKKGKRNPEREKQIKEYTKPISHPRQAKFH